MIPRLRPFIKWAGGKAHLLPRLTPYFPPRFNSYIEPFLGGGAVFFHLQPDQALLGDANPDLIETWTMVRVQVTELATALDRHVAAAGADEAMRRDYYYRLRAQDPKHLEPVERAARFVYLNKTCYNGLYRVNRAGRFNVPFGRHSKHPQVYDSVDLRAISTLLQHATLQCTDFAATMAIAREGDFIYIDPPYDPLSTTANFTSYTPESFPWSDQERLAEAIRDADSRGALVLLNNSDTPNIRALYNDLHIASVPANRSINSDPARRRGATELVITNYAV